MKKMRRYKVPLITAGAIIPGDSSLFPFLAKEGMQENLSSKSSPAEIYQLLVNDEILNRIVLETGRYAKQVITSNPPTKNSRLYK